VRKLFNLLLRLAAKFDAEIGRNLKRSSRRLP
jgi:hypothetical protein